MEQLIYNVLKQWGCSNCIIECQFHEDSLRLIYLIIFNEERMILKGIPDTQSEDVIKGNVLAHEYLGNQKLIAPKIIYLPDGSSYVHEEGYFFYLLEYIQGRVLEETTEDEYGLGKLARRLHTYKGYRYPSNQKGYKKEFYEWFTEKSFKKQFDEILDQIPNFGDYDQCFIHTDLGPHNTMMRTTGEFILIDLDDSGIGSRYLDLGWPFIMQFVDFNHENHKKKYRFDLARAFLQGYYGEDEISKKEYDLIWQGAIYMHISYMQIYGPDAIDSLWEILIFGMEQKEKLWEDINSKIK